MHRFAFDSFAVNDNKFQIDTSGYVLGNKGAETSNSDNDDSDEDELLVYRECKITVPPPHICMWDYLTKPEVIFVLSMKNKTRLRKFIDSKIQKKPKGCAKIVFRELMFTVVKFCKTNKFSPEQAGAVLSQFYLTHVFFTSALDIGAEKVYNYFKDLQICHSLPFPPSSIKIFNLEEIRTVMTYFCKMYLRNLPIIRILTLPNFTLQANYYIAPEKPRKKKGKDKNVKKKK